MNKFKLGIKDYLLLYQLYLACGLSVLLPGNLASACEDGGHGQGDNLEASATFHMHWPVMENKLTIEMCAGSRCTW